MENLDCVVIGAGWYGLASAKQYHTQNPDHVLAILDSSPTIGGVWAEHRLYPGLKSNCLRGSYEFPDFPLTDDYGVPDRKYLPGEVINRYHVSYAKHFGIHPFFRGSTRVVSAEHEAGDGGWTLTIQSGYDVQNPDHDLPSTQIFTKRLIVATGLTSDPFMPTYAGQDDYGAPLFHSRDFKQNADTLEAGRTRRVTVLGGSKSAWDAVYAYGSRGIPVDWVIRQSGHGPCWMSPSFVTPFKKWLEALVNIRLLTWFSPCVWAQDGGYQAMRRFYHGTAVGRAITKAFWSVLGGDVMSLCRFDSHPELAKLKPWTDAFYAGCSFSILNYDTDFFDLVRSGVVKVHIADVDHLSHHKVHLADAEGTVLESDAFVSVTGWRDRPPLKFLPEGIEAELGMPHYPPSEPVPTDLASQRHLFDRADAEILSRFPRLKDPGSFNKRYVPLAQQKGVTVDENKLTPTSPTSTFLLHRFMVPPSARFLRTKDIAFVGFNMNFSNAITAHVQGLWVSAYFAGKLERDPSAVIRNDDGDEYDRSSSSSDSSSDKKWAAEKTLQDLQYETVLHNRMGKWRYPHDHGAKHPDFVFEALPFLDTLVADLGLPVHRKKSWFSEVTEPYGVKDYSNVNEQYVDRLKALEMP
ncbi:hypothetical protein MCOR02_004860 [Pyricularia oryzae]|uniref:Uncharacterized protein n=3 Tax=Pyricularia TaxID=48558 RepID=A0ABQ8NGC6_PYRGI|nr:hypothetical protein MCOR02_004860 [Pyricularia oryzae]KAI6296679.1 hypothetical protein MCOR33_006794 [Pyricularia grisea]KAI6263165.1 hypothetical protein MCOR19_000652 [Pyricularia oryzae]KAI6285017.1 hypothetical protein MCOR26_001716 [Pyricularia oryzae]KAI6311869.1 hypothetical protein MCOR34_005867 [Pyricularia oryzae]